MHKPCPHSNSYNLFRETYKIKILVSEYLIIRYNYHIGISAYSLTEWWLANKLQNKPLEEVLILWRLSNE